MTDFKPDKLAEEHWEFTANVIEWTLKLKGTEEEEIARLIDFARNLYIPAMVHGYKHAVADLSVQKDAKQ